MSEDKTPDTSEDMVVAAVSDGAYTLLVADFSDSATAGRPMTCCEPPRTDAP